ncbi:MAG: hypothetical protein Q8P11_01555 [bacterium]|nr:hypothetical protein [bacterium]
MQKSLGVHMAMARSGVALPVLIISFLIAIMVIQLDKKNTYNGAGHSAPNGVSQIPTK